MPRLRKAASRQERLGRVCGPGGEQPTSFSWTRRVCDGSSTAFSARPVSNWSTDGRSNPSATWRSRCCAEKLGAPIERHALFSVGAIRPALSARSTTSFGATRGRLAEINDLNSPLRRRRPSYRADTASEGKERPRRAGIGAMPCSAALLHARRTPSCGEEAPLYRPRPAASSRSASRP